MKTCTHKINYASDFLFHILNAHKCKVTVNSFSFKFIIKDVPSVKTWQRTKSACLTAATVVNFHAFNSNEISHELQQATSGTC